jgi:predicted phage terminase large subunit-like protein
MEASTAARILLRRRRMRESLLGFAQSIQIPGAPVGGDDSELFAPVGEKMAKHHVILCNALQECIDTDYGRTMVLLPPGAAKSTYASSIAPAWAMGRWPGYQVILASYATELAKKHGKKARAICKQAVYNDAFDGSTLRKDTSAAEMWATTNGSEYMAGGLQSGLTGNRADLLIIDDPIKGAEAADSQTIRAAIMEAIELDAMTRLKPKASVFLIQTRWHPLDPAGQLLPDDYDGRCGPVVCSDGMTWNVINIPAECEREDDPLGRAIGEMLWPEYLDPERHWRQFRGNARLWAALCQQRPTVAGGGRFKEEWVQWYDEGEAPDALNYYGADDYGAPPELGSAEADLDFTEMGVAGLDEKGDIWLMDWFYQQAASTDTGIKNFIRLAKKWRIRRWFGEKGVIHNSISGTLNRAKRESQMRCQIELLSSFGSKVAKAEAFFALCEQGKVHFPRTEWARRLVAQLVAFPVVAHDDGVDVCALFGRALDGMAWAYVPPVEEHRDLKPFSQEWLFYNEKPAQKGGRTR